MDESILDSIKKYLGIGDDCDSFDQELIININPILSILYQIGVESARSAIIEDNEITWEELFVGDEDLIPMIKQYICIKVKLAFDPPSNSFVFEALNKNVSELEWRINLEAEGGFEDLPSNGYIKKSKNSYDEDY